MSQPAPDPVLNTQNAPSASEASQPSTYTYYHAGPLFTAGDLHTNTILSSLIHTKSHQKFIPLLPQDLEPRSLHPHNIRDTDILSLLSCDLALFTYDGSELDSGTVVEYMVAKFADIPSVILRTDFRGAGDQGSTGGEAAAGATSTADTPDAWNLMSSFWPRTKVVRVDSMGGYKSNLAAVLSKSALLRGTGGGNSKASSQLLEEVAEKCVRAMNEVVAMPSIIPKELRKPVYEWLQLMPGFKNGDVSEVKKILEGKLQREL